MNRQRGMPDGSRFAGRAVGHKDAFAKAQNSGYHNRPRLSTDGQDIYLAGRWVGCWHADSMTFRKRIHDRHLLKKPPAICIDAGIVDDLRRRGCERIVVHLQDQGRWVAVPFSRFVGEAFAINRGFGEQLALPLSRWRDLSEERQQLALLEVDM